MDRKGRLKWYYHFCTEIYIYITSLLLPVSRIVLSSHLLRSREPSAIDFGEAESARANESARSKVDRKDAKRRAFDGRRVRSAFPLRPGDSPYASRALLHGWHAIQSRGGRRQLRHCASTCLFATCECLVQFAVNAVTSLSLSLGRDVVL